MKLWHLRKIRYLACTDVNINVLQLINIYIIQIPNFRHIKKSHIPLIPFLWNCVDMPFPFFFFFFFWGGGGGEALINSAFVLQHELLVQCMDLTSFRR